MKAFGSLELLKARALSHTKIKICTKALGTTIKRMAKACIPTARAHATKDNSSRISSMVRDMKLGSKEQNIKGPT